MNLKNWSGDDSMAHRQKKAIQMWKQIFEIINRANKWNWIPLYVSSELQDINVNRNE